MKKFILLLGVLALGFTSCSKKSENLKVIPKDAIAVVSFDLQSLYKKADVEELQKVSKKSKRSSTTIIKKWVKFSVKY